MAQNNRFSIEAVAAERAEGGDGVELTFMVKRTGNAKATASVDWDALGWAENPANGADFEGGVMPAGTITFAPGQRQKLLVIAIQGDNAVEATEGFNVLLSNPVGGTLGPAWSAGTWADGVILNDDVAGTPPPNPDPTPGPDPNPDPPPVPDPTPDPDPVPDPTPVPNPDPVPDPDPIPDPDPVPGTALKHEGVNIFSAFDGPDWGNPNARIGTDYIYPTRGDIDYFTSKGMDTFRLGVHAIHLLDADGADDMAIVDDLVKYAETKGAKVVLDIHDFGRTMTGKLIGRDAGATAEFQAEWTTLANHFKDSPNVIFGLMNEPHEVTAREWLVAANAGIAAIRATGAKQEILVPGTQWSNAESWVSSGNAEAMDEIVDPLNNYAVETHAYLDPGGSGSSAEVVPGKGATVLKPITDWARANGEKLFLGEFGFGRDAASLIEGDAINDFTHANKDVWEGQTYWVGGPWWQNYRYTVQPDDAGNDRPQMAVLDDYLPK